MIKSSTRAGVMIINALKRADMLGVNKYGLSVQELLNLHDDTVRESFAANFEKDKFDYYETRPVQAIVNGKFGATGSYDSALQQLTVTMTPTGSTKDIGKVVTFFDSSMTTPPGYAGLINDFIAPNIYAITLFYPIPNIPAVINVTVIDWLVTGSVIRLIPPNEIATSEHLEIVDIFNNEVIDIVSYDEFNRRATKLIYSSSTKHWARYKSNAIEFAAGSQAPALGTIRISAYWVPPRSTNFGSSVYAPDKRLGEIEERLVLKLLSRKLGRPMPETAVRQEEMESTVLTPKYSRQEREKVT